MRVNTIERIAGTTLKVTWVNSGSTPTGITSALRDRAETVTTSITATSSGNGFFYAFHFLPTSYGGPSPNEYWLINEWVAIINSNTYTSRQLVHVTLPEVG